MIMPNHIHLMWEQLKMNGKEFPKNSRQYNLWQRDPLAIRVFSKEMSGQKLDYMPARQVIQAGI